MKRVTRRMIDANDAQKAVQHGVHLHVELVARSFHVLEGTRPSGGRAAMAGTAIDVFCEERSRTGG